MPTQKEEVAPVLNHGDSGWHGGRFQPETPFLDEFKARPKGSSLAASLGEDTRMLALPHEMISPPAATIKKNNQLTCQQHSFLAENQSWQTVPFGAGSSTLAITVCRFFGMVMRLLEHGINIQETNCERIVFVFPLKASELQET